MEIKEFKQEDLKRLWMPTNEVGKMNGGQVTIIGGSKLFHGAPVLSLRAASRIVSMVYFASPIDDKMVVDVVKADLGSFIWIPIEDLDDYLAKSDSCLIGPGMMRSGREKDGFACDNEGKATKTLTLNVLNKFSDKKWVIDGGSLQVIKVEDIPNGSVITPNKKEYKMLFGEDLVGSDDEKALQLTKVALKFDLTILYKDVVSIVTDGTKTMTISGGNAGLIRGGTGDILAGLTVGFSAKNDGVIAAAAASYLVKKAAERLEGKFGLMFNADDLVDEVRAVYGEGVST